MSDTVRVIPPAEMPEPPAPVARRKGQAGAWQVLHEGKWISERAVKAHEALLACGGHRQLAAVRAGLTNDEFRRAIDVYDKATGGKAKTPAASVKTERPRLVKPEPEAYYAPKPALLESELVEVDTEAQTAASPADASSVPEPIEAVLEETVGGDVDDAYDVGFADGFVDCLLTVIVESERYESLKAPARRAQLLIGELR